MYDKIVGIANKGYCWYGIIRSEAINLWSEFQCYEGGENQGDGLIGIDARYAENFGGDC